MTALTIAPPDLQQAMQFCKVMSESDFVPKAYKGNPGNILAAVTMGAELGLGPMQSLLGIAVINGKPSVYGDTLMSLVLGHPDCEDVIETIENAGTNEAVARCEVRRKGRQPVVRTFSMADAARAELSNKKGPWQDYPDVMLKHRARGFALRDSFADALAGLISAEEARDYRTSPRAAPQPDPEPTCEPTIIDAQAVEVREAEEAATPKVSEEVLHVLAVLASIEVPEQSALDYLNIESIEQITKDHIKQLRELYVETKKGEPKNGNA